MSADLNSRLTIPTVSTTAIEVTVHTIPPSSKAKPLVINQLHLLPVDFQNPTLAKSASTAAAKPSSPITLPSTMSATSSPRSVVHTPSACPTPTILLCSGSDRPPTRAGLAATQTPSPSFMVLPAHRPRSTSWQSNTCLSVLFLVKLRVPLASFSRFLHPMEPLSWIATHRTRSSWCSTLAMESLHLHSLLLVLNLRVCA